MTESGRPIGRLVDINAYARKLEVDNRIALDKYYRIASNLLKQASIYREEKNSIDLYIILLRFSSLISETIPLHRDYQVLPPKRRNTFKKKLLEAITELESLKPIVQRQVEERNNSYVGHPNTHFLPDSQGTGTQFSPSDSTKVEGIFQKLSLSLLLPKEETLSRHSVLGPNGLRSQWLGPVSGAKANYPTSSELTSLENSSQLYQLEQSSHGVQKADVAGGQRSFYESVLSLDDGRGLCASDYSFSLPTEATHENNAHLEIVRQPSPPPVLAFVQPKVLPIDPSKVADPRPGPAKGLHDGNMNSKAYQHLHISPRLLENFLRIAETNTAKNLETCAVLAGSLKDRTFFVTTLIIPKQESTSDSCQTSNEEEIFDCQDKLSLFPLGWIHTHPSQTCFMSSIDLHTHYSYQVMLPEAIAIVMAPTDESSPHGIFHLSDPGGVTLIRNCQERGFHPHEEPPDGSPLYEHCSHVYMNLKLKFDVVDLR